MNETRDLRLKIYKYTLLVAIVAAVVAFFLVKDYIPFIKGLAFGTIIAILNFTLLAKTLEKSISLPPEKAKNYVSSRYFIRFTIYGAVLYISVVAEYINIFGTITGILSIKLVVYVLHLFNDKNYYKNIFQRKSH